PATDEAAPSSSQAPTPSNGSASGTAPRVKCGLVAVTGAGDVGQQASTFFPGWSPGPVGVGAVAAICAAKAVSGGPGAGVGVGTGITQNGPEHRPGLTPGQQQRLLQQVPRSS
ncbi:unnamed protein product, partial [Discosporangium mesarthrocarpum]